MLSWYHYAHYFSTLMVGKEQEKVLSTFLPSSLLPLFSSFSVYQLGSKHLSRMLLHIVAGKNICKNHTPMEKVICTKFNFFISETISMKDSSILMTEIRNHRLKENIVVCEIKSN